jgi:hypothetical protein
MFGVIKAWHATDEAWRLRPIYNPISHPSPPALDYFLHKEPTIMYQEHEFCHPTKAKNLETFMIDNGPWPLTKEDSSLKLDTDTALSWNIP